MDTLEGRCKCTKDLSVIAVIDLYGAPHQPSLQPVLALVTGMTATLALRLMASERANASDSIISLAWLLTLC